MNTFKQKSASVQVAAGQTIARVASTTGMMPAIR